MNIRKDLKVSGMIVLEKYPTDAANGEGLWSCRCLNCSRERPVKESEIVTGEIYCTCSTSKSKTFHGRAGTTEYLIWQHMRGRCYNPRNVAFRYYGGRGIGVCKQWLDPDKGFISFYEDMGPRPSPKHSLDKIDNNADYSPENCRWVLFKTQVLNRRNQKGCSSDFRGVSWAKHYGKWHSYIRDNGKRINIGYYDKEEDAARAHDTYARKIGYEEAWLNFPNEEI